MNMTKQNARRGAMALASLLLGVACCLWPAQASAQQWTTSGNNITNSNPGNVTVRSDIDVSPLTIRGTNSNVIGFGVSNDQAGSRGWAFQVAGSDSFVGAVSGTFIMRQATDNINPLIIDPAGNVGIGGLMRPNYKLDVLGALNASGGLCMGGVCKTSWAEAGQWAAGNGSNISYVAGSVGIGTAAPAAKLDVVQANATVLRALSGSSGAHANIQLGRTAAEFSLGIAAAPGQYSIAAGAGDVVFRTEDASKRLLFSNGPGAPALSLTGGNVGIGMTTPSHKLHVGGGTIGIQNSASDATLSAFSGAANESATFGWSKSGFAYLQGGAWGGVAKNVVLQGGGGNVSVGTPNPNSSARFHVAGDITADGNIAAKYQDVAEWVPSTQKLLAGTVVILDENKTNHVQASTFSYDTKVAGVVSARPGLILGEAGEGKLMVATTGRVKVKVDATRAPIKVGDLLVTSDVEGIAMKSEPVKVGGRKMHAPGTIIGKALEPLGKGVGEILVLLSLQ